MKKSKFDFRYDIAVSGSSNMKVCTKGTREKAFELGKELAKNKCIVISGATDGIPFVVSCGNREAGGFNLGFSPAISKSEHVKSYKLPLDPYDVIVYTGEDYAGRDVVMTKASEAVIIISGETGTMHEFLTAFETGKVIGVLEGSGGIADGAKKFLEGIRKKPKASIFFSDNPKKLVKEIVLELKKKEKKMKKGKVC
ncbi:MAG: hypothetical protein PHG24_00985 [Candidatus Pacebacteria bacterium]|nr:hypothetical protein [Candidatus Paceibacterota bacterium]